MAAIRATRVLRGQYSRMMDLGGVPSAKTGPIRTVDGSKNCKVRVVAFDFDLLTRSVEDDKKKESPLPEPKKIPSPVSTVMVDKVQEIASLLKVNLGGQGSATSDTEEDDLSALMGEQPHAEEKKKAPAQVYSSDIRTKYANKLKSRGGLAGVETAKRAIEESLRKGDAAGHLAARAAAVSQSSGDNRWMVSQGTGTLLSYISNRSMEIALLPIPNQDDPKAGLRMKEITKQLPSVSFGLLIDKGDDANDILNQVSKKFKVDPIATMVVSDRDDYLRAAKDNGMVACRIRPSNAPQGNISAHYKVETMDQVLDVVNEINGISFSATFAAGKR